MRTIVGTENIYQQTVHLEQEDLRRHLYAVGESGSGKSSFLLSLLIQLIEQGQGVALLDPHGDLAGALLDHIPPGRIQDVVYFDPGDTHFPVGYNPIQKVTKDDVQKVVQSIDNAFKATWPDTYGESSNRYIFTNLLRTTLLSNISTFLSVRRTLTDEAYQAHTLRGTKDISVKEFWNEWESFKDRDRINFAWSTKNKLGQFLQDPMMRNILGQERSSLKARQIMDKKQIFIANLSKGRVGHLNSRLLGALLVQEFYRAAMERIDTPEEDRNDFTMVVDEFQNFVSESFENILSEARKYRLSLVLAHQYMNQLTEGVKHAVFGNAGSMLSFRVGYEDAIELSRHFDRPPANFVELPRYETLSRILKNADKVDYRLKMLDPNEYPKHYRKDTIIEESRKKYGTPRGEIEGKLQRWYEV